NIVPERAAGVFYIRAATMPHLEQLKKRVHGCLRAGAEASGAELHVRTVGEDYSDMWTNPALAAAYAANAGVVGRTIINVDSVPGSVAGSTDMGNISK